MNSQNINTNVAKIVMTTDMEIRKIKKPKKKSSLEKKKLLKELKEILKQYDAVVAIAAEKKIELPAELGLLPDNVADINSIKELKAFIATLKLRIAQINQLIAQGEQKAKTGGLFGENTGMRFPLLPARVTPSVIQPSVIQPSIPANPVPINPASSGAEKSLEALRQEILSKLSPADRARAEAQRAAGQESGVPVQPSGAGAIVPASALPPPPLDTSDPKLFSRDIGFDTGGGNRVNIVSPKGWTDIYTQYRMYIEDILAKLQKVDKGVFELPMKESQELNTERLRILNAYSAWSSGLLASQNLLLDSDKLLQKLNSDMLRELELDPKDIILQIAKEQRIPLTEITEGETSLEKAAKEKGLSPAAKEFKSKLDKNNFLFYTIVSTVDKLAKEDRLRMTIQNLNTIKMKEERLFNSLSGADRVSILSDYNKFEADIANLSASLEAKIQAKNSDVDITIDPVTYKHSGAAGAAPSPPAQPSPPADPDTKFGSQVKGGRYVKNGIIVSQGVIKALGRLVTFTREGVATQYNEAVRVALNTVILEEKFNTLINRAGIQSAISNLPISPAVERNNTARGLVKDEVVNKILLPSWVTGGAAEQGKAGGAVVVGGGGMGVGGDAGVPLPDWMRNPPLPPSKAGGGKPTAEEQEAARKRLGL